MQFKSYSWAARVEMIETALPGVLAALTYKSPTGLIVERLAAAMGQPVEDGPAISNVLLKLAPMHPLASHDGSEFTSWGKKARHWMWSQGDSSAWRFKEAKQSGQTAGAGDLNLARKLLAAIEAKREEFDEDDEGAHEMLDWMRDQIGAVPVAAEPARPAFMPEEWRILTAKQLAYVDVKLSPAQQREWDSPANTAIRAERAARIANANAGPATAKDIFG